MTELITTPEQMREAAAQELHRRRMEYAWHFTTDAMKGVADAAVTALLNAEMAIRAIPVAPQPVWPDFIAPPKYDNPDPRWADPALPDFRLIWKVARECGYAVGLHGSMKRDCDLIAVPWTDEAVLAFDLIESLCAALNAQVIGPVAGKPHGRLGWNLQVDGYVKVIDISVVPRSVDSPIDATPARDVRAAALREAAAEAAGEIAAHGYSELSAFLRHRILAMIDKEPQS